MKKLSMVRRKLEVRDFFNDCLQELRAHPEVYGSGEDVNETVEKWIGALKFRLELGWRGYPGAEEIRKRAMYGVLAYVCLWLWEESGRGDVGRDG